MKRTSRQPNALKFYMILVPLLLSFIVVTSAISTKSRNPSPSHSPGNFSSILNAPLGVQDEPLKPIELPLTCSVEPIAKPIMQPTLSAYEPSEIYYYNVSHDDKIAIAKVVFAESRGECFEGKVAVAAVVLNRFFHGSDRDFDKKSILSVIQQKSQFASIKGITLQNLDKIPDCMKAVEAACKGWDPTRKLFPEGALFFYAPEGVKGKAAEAREGIKVLEIGNHNFHIDFKKIY